MVTRVVLFGLPAAAPTGAQTNSPFWAGSQQQLRGSAPEKPSPAPIERHNHLPVRVPHSRPAPPTGPIYGRHRSPFPPPAATLAAERTGATDPRYHRRSRPAWPLTARAEALTAAAACDGGAPGGDGRADGVRAPLQRRRRPPRRLPPAQHPPILVRHPPHRSFSRYCDAPCVSQCSVATVHLWAPVWVERCKFEGGTACEQFG